MSWGRDLGSNVESNMRVCTAESALLRERSETFSKLESSWRL